MELFLFLFIALAVFAVVSVALGEDSRDGYRTERQLPLATPWV
ncbi:MAG TPA: hypothetical protein VKC59_08060 [Candidatus Limnocylindrales bacterium]|nr:hypothetical protein [Candidatus Limnocylindrales bacterium]